MTSQQQKHHAACRLDELISQRAQAVKGFRIFFLQLIHVIRSRSSLLSPRRFAGSDVDFTDAVQIINACARMACHRFSWKRTPVNWNVPAASPLVQMRSLAHYLFDEYPVPDFMASVWWKAYPEQWEIDLYLYLATGRGVRQFSKSSPLQLTRKMAMLFMLAPDHFQPAEAFRWAQVLALGGDERLARILILRTCLSRQTEDENFWETVIRFLIQNDSVCADEISAIIEFIHQQRFEPAEKVWCAGAGEKPVQPDFSLRGRSLKSLRRHMTHWRSELIEKGMLPPPTIDPLDYPWQRSSIRAFTYEQEGSLWSIEELLTPRELHWEGRIMNHCVASYISDCATGKTTIWSMKVKTGRRKRHQLTIELQPNRKVIYQARGKHNCSPSDKVRDILNRWATQEGLKFREQA